MRFSLYFVLLIPPILVLMLLDSAIAAGDVIRDSGVFLYEGQQILEGAVPYRDIWDQKGPIIYYVNALGLLIGSGSPFGVLILEGVSVYIAAVLCNRILWRHFGGAAALLGTVAWLVAMHFVLGGGNYTEEFALMFQFGIYGALPGARDSRDRWIRWSFIGVSFAICFWLKPSLVGIAVCAALYLVVDGCLRKEWRLLVRDLGAYVVGLVGVSALVLGYFSSQGAFAHLFDQVIRYNLVYSGSATLSPAGFRDRLSIVRDGWAYLSTSPIVIASVLGWYASIWLLWRLRFKDRATKAVVVVALLDLPFEVILTVLSGHNYDHLFMTWLPTMAVLAGSLVYAISGGTRLGIAHLLLTAKPLASIVVALGVAVSLLAIAKPTSQLPQAVHSLRTSYQRFALNQGRGIILARTTASDTVLVWGAEAGLNFLSGRRAPTRYVYQYPLYVKGYQDLRMIREFLDDIKVMRPKLIIDSSETNFSIPPIEKGSRDSWKEKRAPISEFQSVLLPDMDEVFSYINSRYQQETAYGNNWKVYHLTDDVVKPGDISPKQSTNFVIGRDVALRGYDLASGPLRPGGKFQLRLYWEPLTIPDRDFTVFVQVLDTNGLLRAQHDGYPLQGRYPTSSWRPGELIRDSVEVALPPDIAPGTYQIIAGMYELKTLTRLEISDRYGHDLGDHVSVSTISVVG